MRRILLIVAMLLVAAPAMAGVSVKAVHLPRGGGTPFEMTCCAVEVNYTSDAPGQVRAFALDINVDSGFIIRAIRNFQSGVSTDKSPCVYGYGIFPGKFRDYIDPNNPAWTDPNYNPVAPSGDPDAKTGLGTDAITVELGSLYYGDANKPTQDGTLFRIEVIPSEFGAAECNLTLAVNSTRGGVVDINGDPITPTFPTNGTCKVTYLDCFPCWPPFGAASLTQYAEWLTVFKPNCWCGQAGVPVWNTQCKGDADNKTETFSKYRVYKSDYAKLALCWAKKETQMRFDPNCICADFDHRYETFSKYRVYKSDYARLAANWAKKETQLKPFCPVE